MFWNVAIANLVCLLGITLQAGATALIWHWIPALARWALKKHGARRGLWRPAILVQIVLATFMAIAMVQMAMWAGVFVLCGEFQDYGLAFYHSAVNFTTLGYGDMIMSERWRILGPIEALNGILLLGLSSATIFSVFTTVRDLRAKMESDASFR